MQRGYNMLDKSIREYKKSYKEKCGILEVNTKINNLRNIYFENQDFLGWNSIPNDCRVVF